jgi:uncharacterized protein YwqG
MDIESYKQKLARVFSDIAALEFDDSFKQNIMNGMLREMAWMDRQRVSIAELPLGASRLGGLPDLPPDEQWPTQDGRPMHFLGQFDLAEISCSFYKLPPSQLMLYVFYDFENMEWGPSYNGDGFSVKIFENPDRQKLHRWNQQDAPCEIFDCCAVSLRFSWDVPHHSNILITGNLESDQMAAYNSFRKSLSSKSSRHKLFGWPTPVQGDIMQFLCEEKDRGVKIIDEPNVDMQVVTSALQRWYHLMQLGSDDGEDGPGWMFSDVGKLHLWVPVDDENMDYSRMMMCVQSH